MDSRPRGPKRRLSSTRPETVEQAPWSVERSSSFSMGGTVKAAQATLAVYGKTQTEATGNPAGASSGCPGFSSNHREARLRRVHAQRPD